MEAWQLRFKQNYLANFATYMLTTLLITNLSPLVPPTLSPAPAHPSHPLPKAACYYPRSSQP